MTKKEGEHKNKRGEGEVRMKKVGKSEDEGGESGVSHLNSVYELHVSTCALVVWPPAMPLL
jgi:hypothetical protein